MPVAGIIAEYNPFHNGHAWHIARVRARLPGAAVVCVMSGQITQRGELAICRKQARAAMALSGGADLVLELPAPYACAAAERFARAGVFMLAATGVVTHLCFGSETGRLEPLIHAARVLDSPSFLPAQEAGLQRGLSYPAARHKALETLAPEAAGVLSNPNDILGVEYLRALRHWRSDIIPLVSARKGVAHDTMVASGVFASGSLIRARLLEGEAFSGFVPTETLALWRQECSAGRAPVSLHACERAVLYALRRMSADDFRALPDVTEGLEHRLTRAAWAAVSLEDFYTRVKTRRYTHARIRRLALRAFLGLRDTQGQPPYLRVLAANETGLSLLREMKAKKSAALPILVKPASVKRMDKAALSCFISEAQVTDLYALCYPDSAQWAGGKEWSLGLQIDS